MDTEHDGERHLLCLKCGITGHKVSRCHLPVFLVDRDTQHSKTSTETIAAQRPGDYDRLCGRCQSLDVATWLAAVPSFDVVEGLSAAHEEDDQDVFRTLGLVKDLELSSKCSLCVCFYNMMPTPSAVDQTVTLGLGWTLHRLEHSSNDTRVEGRPTSRCLTVILEPLEPGEEVHRTMSVQNEALAIAQDDSVDSSATLGAVEIDAGRINVEMLRRWLRVCENSHKSTCYRPASPAMRLIRLLDVRTRRIVPWSTASQDFVALSYVWGGVDQRLSPSRSPREPLPRLPQTVEDAMVFTSVLGKRYLWVDSVCIDQDDDQDKLEQIAIMSSIYRAAFATIVALSGQHANAGLPRISARPSYTQVSCYVDGKRLMTLGPTLEHLLDGSRWGTRAWTYQEALLSPRCIFLTDAQMHFECNGMTCAESIDGTPSPPHSRSHQATYSQSLNLGAYRNPLTRPINQRGDALNVYSILASSYSRLEMTHSSDALLAFSGALQVLEDNAYKDGFWWGLPRIDLNWAMAWQAHDAQASRNPNFPSWTWLGTRSGMWPGGPEIGGSQNTPTTWPFDMELQSLERLYGRRSIFASSYEEMSEQRRAETEPDPLAPSSTIDVRGSYDPPASSNYLDYSRLLLFDSFALEFAVLRRWEEPGNEDHSLVIVEVGGEEIRGITTYDPESNWMPTEEHLWLVLTRHIDGDHMVFNMILLEPREGVFGRADMLRLHVRREKAMLIRDLGLHRLRGILM